MPTTQYVDYYPYVQPYVPGCPEAVISAYIAEAANAFCDKTYLWRVPLPDTNTVADTQDYVVTPPADTELVDVLLVEFEGTPIDRTHDVMMPLFVADVSAQPNAYSLVEPATIRFYPPPNDEYTFRGVMVLKPTLTCAGAASFLFLNHGRCIAAGALERLFSIPNKPWSDPAQAAYYSRYYDKALADARIHDTRSVNRHVRQIPFA